MSQYILITLLIAATIQLSSAVTPPTAPPTAPPTYSPTAPPTYSPTSMPSATAWEYQTVWDMTRWRKTGICDMGCSGHGTCDLNQNCNCYTDLDGNPSWTNPICSERTCPKDMAWVSETAKAANDVHPTVECSNKGICNRGSGVCECFTGYEGSACQRTVCPDDCNDKGICWPMQHVAVKWNRVYSTPWDRQKALSCICDSGFRGPSCGQQECPTGSDPLGGLGNEAARDCSGRGTCDYDTGICKCFNGFKGNACQTQYTHT